MSLDENLEWLRAFPYDKCISLRRLNKKFLLSSNEKQMVSTEITTRKRQVLLLNWPKNFSGTKIKMKKLHMENQRLNYYSLTGSFNYRKAFTRLWRFELKLNFWHLFTLQLDLNFFRFPISQIAVSNRFLFDWSASCRFD